MKIALWRNSLLQIFGNGRLYSLAFTMEAQYFRVFWCQSVERFKFILMKTKHPVHIIVFGVVTSDDDVMPTFILPHGFTINTEAYIKWLKCLCWPRSSGCLLEDLTLRQATQAKEPRNFCDHITPTSVRLTPQIVIPLIIKSGTQLIESVEILRNWWSSFTEYQQPLGVTWCPL